MTTYTIKPIEWRQGIFINSMEAYVGRLNIGNYYFNGDSFVASFYEYKGIYEKNFSTMDKAEPFIETSYKEFVEQFLEKI